MTQARSAMSAAAAALALATLATAAPPALAATTESHFQQSLTIDCPGSCSRKFPQLPANQSVDVDHISCEFITDGVLTFVRLTLLPTSLNFSYPVPLAWQRKFLDGNVYTLAADVNIRVPFGRQVQIDLVSGGAPKGLCALTGTRLTNS